LDINSLQNEPLSSYATIMFKQIAIISEGDAYLNLSEKLKKNLKLLQITKCLSWYLKGLLRQTAILFTLWDEEERKSNCLN
jgi:hypothetical protein